MLNGCLVKYYHFKTLVMKKGKLILHIAAVIAAICSAFAFKVQNAFKNGREQLYVWNPVLFYCEHANVWTDPTGFPPFTQYYTNSFCSHPYSGYVAYYD